MRRRISLFALTLLAMPGAAQQHLTKTTVDSGGGRSASARYALTGSIGQPDAVPLLSGGRYRIGGGFWAALPSNEVFSDSFESDPD